MINKELIEKAAEKYDKSVSLGDLLTTKIFTAGANWALKEVENVVIEFAEWVEKYGYIYYEKSKVWAYWDNPTKEFSTKELFEIFLKERNGNKN